MFNATRKTQVLVLGAGPVGLLAAMTLARRGIEVGVVDVARRAEEPPEGLVLHARSLLLLDRLGLAEQLIEQGRRIDGTGLYLGVERVAVIKQSNLPTAYPFALTLAHNVLVDVLEAELARYRVRVQWLHRLLDIEQDDEHVRLQVGQLGKQSPGYRVAHIEQAVDSTTRWQAGYVIATDGPRSLAPAHIGALRPTLGRERYVVLETRAGPDTGAESRVGLVDEHLAYAMWPVPDGRLRWIVQLDRLPVATNAELLDLVGQLAPWFRPLPTSLVRRAMFEVERWLAQPLGRGRVWLAGNAAHQTSPLSSQSINSGLGEAYELADRVALALSGHGTDRSLQAYSEHYRRDWERLLCTAGAPQRLSAAPAWSGSQAERVVAALPATGADLGLLLHQIGLSYSPGVHRVDQLFQ